MRDLAITFVLGLIVGAVVVGLIGQTRLRDQRAIVERLEEENRELAGRLGEIQVALDRVTAGLGVSAGEVGSIADGVGGVSGGVGDVADGLDRIIRDLGELAEFLGRVAAILSGGEAAGD